MPNFGSSQTCSGPAGAPGKNGGGQRVNVWCVGYGGVGIGRNDGNTVSVNGVGPTAPGLGKRTGPNEAPAFQPMFGSYKQKFRGNFSITGTAYDSNNATVSEARIELHDSRSVYEYAETVSDGSGNYSFTVPWNSSQYQILAYKTGSPDIAGVTVDTLIPVWNGN